MIIIFFITIFIIEGFHDFYIIRLDEVRDYINSQYIRGWHKASFISWIVIALYVCYINYGFTFQTLYSAAFIGLIRNFVLNTTLNILRDKALWHLGEEGIDGVLKPYEKLWWFTSLIAIIFVLITVKF